MSALFRGLAGGTVALVSTVGLVGFAAPAGAATTLHFYSVSQQQAAYDPSGHVITNQNAPAAVGDRFESTHVDFSGTHKHHSASINASDHLLCELLTITASGGTGVCDGQIAVGGAMLLAEHVAVTFASNGSLSPIPINGGTGPYRGAQGTVRSVGIGKTANADLTITLTKT